MSEVTPLVREQTNLGGRVTANLRGAFAELQIRQVEIAEWLHVSQPNVSERINGKIEWSINEIEIIARHLGIDPLEFMRRPAWHELCPHGDSNSEPTDYKVATSQGSRTPMPAWERRPPSTGEQLTGVTATVLPLRRRTGTPHAM